MTTSLKEHLTYSQANITTESVDEASGKSLYMKGIFIEAMLETRITVSTPKKKLHNAVKAINRKN